MAGEAKNLLTRTLATAADDMMQLYVVHNGRDYRILLKTLLDMVTKARLGLENVNNTSDAQKPVSQAVAQALDLKADKDTTVTREEWNLFIQQFSGMITTEQLNVIIAQIQQTLQSKVSSEVMQQAIDAALAPINVALGDLNTRVNALTTAVADSVTVQMLNNAIASVRSEFTSLNDAFEAYKIANDARVTQVESRVSVLEENQLVFGPNFW